jgi:hypothetical protein
MHFIEAYKIIHPRVLVYIFLSLGLGLHFSNVQAQKGTQSQSINTPDTRLKHYRFLKVDSSMIGWSKGIMVITDSRKRIIDTLYFSEEKTEIEFEEDFYEDSDSIIYDSTRYKEFISNENYTLASIVGNIISVDYSYYFEGGAHPYYGFYTKIYGLNTKDPSTLFDLFNEVEVVKSLKQDSSIKRMIPDLICNDYLSCIETISSELGKYEITRCSKLNSLLETFYIINYWNGIAKVGFNFQSEGGCHYGENTFSLFLSIKVRKDKRKLFKMAKRNKTLGVYLQKSLSEY